MLIADDDGLYVDGNPAACELLGLSHAELCTYGVADFTTPDAKAEFAAVWKRFLEAGQQRGQYQLQLRDGRTRDVEFSASANIQPGRHLSIIRDVSERTAHDAAREQLIHSVRTLSRTDPLTQLPNRRVWAERVTDELGRAKRSGQPLVMAIIDLDDFKTFNDTRGHNAGDHLLQAIAIRWAAQLRGVDLLARVGGDEFYLLLPNCGAGQEAGVLQRLRAVMPDDQAFSAGVATWDGEEQAEHLLERADRGLYRDKKA